MIQACEYREFDFSYGSKPTIIYKMALFQMRKHGI